MSISYDIISEFVKITNDKKEKSKGETVYATIVQTSDGKYVKLDGSDLVTPTETTTDIEEGERVTVLIKDHSAIITGNITSPSASTNRVNGIVDVVNDKLGVFEIIVADKVDTNELTAYKAEIEHLIAGKAEIEDLKATTAEIKVLHADFANIKTLVNGNLTSDNILSFNITADKVTMEDAFIKDAMVDTINAAKINAGRINTNAVSIGSDDGSMLISGATQQFKDKNDNVRIQIGKDSTGDFTFVLYGEDGKGQIINQNGITASAVSDGLIVNDMINDNAAISGGKLDISSVIIKINEDDSTAIQSSKIFLDQENQSLQVAFGSLKTHVDTIQNESIDGTLADVVGKTQANQTKIEANAEGIKSLVSQSEIAKSEINDMKNEFKSTTTELSNKYTTLNQSLDGFKLEAADTFAKKTTVEELENNLTTNYTTTEAMNSAIEMTAGNVALSVSETKIKNMKIGGANLLLNSDDKRQLDRPETSWNSISYNIINDYANLTLNNDTTFVLSFTADRTSNMDLECFDSIAFDDGWNYRWTRDDLDKLTYVKDHTFKFVMKPKTLPKGTIIADKLSIIAEYEYGGAAFYNVMLAEGDKALDWSPANQDVQNRIATIDIKADEINSTVNTVKQNLNDNYSTTSQMNSAIQQSTDSIKSEVVKIEKSMAIDNLLANGNFTNGLSNWIYNGHGSDVNYTLTANTDWTMVGKTALLLTQTNHPQGCDSGFTQTIDVKPNTDYTFTGYIASHRAEGMVVVKDEAGDWLVFDKTDPDYDQYPGGADISKWKRVRLVYYSGNRNKLQLHLALAKSNDNGHVWFHDFMVTEGNTDLCWKPSERETRTRIDQLSDRITSTVSSIQTVDGKVNRAQSQIDQQAHQIASKVNSGDLSSLIQQNSSSIYAAISNGRGVHGVGIDTSGLYLFNNNLVTARLTEGKFHAYNSWNGQHMGYFGTNGDDLRACLYDTNTFSVYSNDTALLFRARYDRDASYGNATLDMCGGINFIHKPGQDVGVNQILLGNDDRSNAYGYHNMSIRCWNSLGFQDNNGLTNMFFDVRRGRIIMKGGLYQNTQTPPHSYILSNDPKNPFYSGVTSEQMISSILNLETTVKVDTDDDMTMMILPNDDDLTMTMIDNQQHVDIASIVAGLVETVKSLNNRVLELENELNKK